MKPAPAASPSIRIGISSCLLGETVRFDGGHKRDAFLTETMGRFVEWVPVCPEVEAGFGTPRETMRLERSNMGVRLITTRTKRDVTAQLVDYAGPRVEALAAEQLSGYVLKKDSPSCGMVRVKVYDAAGSPVRTGRGLFAERLLRHFPLLPIEDEGRLSDPGLRENFIDRVFAYDRLRRLFDGRWTIGDLVRFHTAHKLMVMVHSPAAYQRIGRMIAGAKGRPLADLKQVYMDEFMAALAVVATPRRHANVLQHMVGYFKKTLDTESKAELLGTIEDYRNGLVPLVVPITLIRHHVRREGVPYLAGQVYLEPHPRGMMLRNHV